MKALVSMDVKNIFISLLAGVMGSVIFLTLYFYTHQNNWGVVRMDQLIRQHLEEYGKKDLSKEEREIIAKKFAKVLEVTINDISRKERVVLLVAPAVVSKLPDYTNRIENEIKRVLDER